MNGDTPGYKGPMNGVAAAGGCDVGHWRQPGWAAGGRWGDSGRLGLEGR